MNLRSYCFLLATASFFGACQPTKSDFCVEQTFVHKYGVAVEPTHWYESDCNGKVITTLRDGCTVTQSFAHGKLNGESTYTYPCSKQLEKKEMYCDDVLVSEVYYSSCGTPSHSIEYTSPDLWKETHWYESGQPRSIESYERGLLLTGDYFTIDNQKDSSVLNGMGERKTRDAWGNLLSLDTIHGGELTLKTIRYPNGSISEIIPFANGKVHGERKSYYPAGDPMAIETWIDGQKNGVTIIFQNGEKYAEVPFLGGKKNGIERRFCDGSRVSQEITWFDDKMHGPTYTYVGNTVQTDWFYKGRLTTRTNFESFAMPKRL